MTEPAKKKQTLFSSMFKNVPNTYEASSSDPTPLLNNTADTSKAKKRTEPEVSCIFEIETYLLCREREADYIANCCIYLQNSEIFGLFWGAFSQDIQKKFQSSYFFLNVCFWPDYYRGAVFRGKFLAL